MRTISDANGKLVEPARYTNLPFSDDWFFLFDPTGSVVDDGQYHPIIYSSTINQLYRLNLHCNVALPVERH
jgi:hypothetical protein